MLEKHELSLVKVLTIAAIGAAFAAVSPAQARDGQSVPATWTITGLQYYADRNVLGFTPYDNTYQRFCKDLTIASPAGAPVRVPSQLAGSRDRPINSGSASSKLETRRRSSHRSSR